MLLKKRSEHDIMDSVSPVSTAKIAGNLKRRAVCSDEVHWSTKKARLEAYSGDSKAGLSVSADGEEDLIARLKKDWSNWLFVDGSVSSDEEEEEFKLNSSKKTSHTYSNPSPETTAREADIQEISLRDEIKVSFKRSNNANVSSKPRCAETQNTSTAINPKGITELSTSNEDIISKSSQEFLRLLLIDVEEQENENENSKKTLEFLPFTPLRTPQKNDRQVVGDKSAQAQDNLRICAPKKKQGAINKNRNAFASLRHTQTRKNNLASDTAASVCVGRGTNSLLSNVTINSVKKPESSKRKLNFQDLCLSETKEENDSGDSDATFCDLNDIHESQAVNESDESELEENQKKKNHSVFECTHKREDCNEGLKLNESFPFIFSSHLNGGNTEQKSKSNVQGPSASLIEGGSQEKSKIISELIFKTTNNATTVAESSKLNQIDCSNSPIESDGSDDSDVTLFDLKNKLASKKESLKSKQIIDLVENQKEQNIFESNVSNNRNRQSNREEGNVSGASDKSFPFIFSQPQCKPEDKISREQKLRPNNGLKDLIYFENSSQGQRKDFILLEGKPRDDVEKVFERKSKGLHDLKDLFLFKDNPEKERRDSIFLEGHPNKGSSNTFENANTNDDLGRTKTDFSFSQPQCKADESRLNKKGKTQTRDGLWKLSNKNPSLSWIEQKSQELLLNTFFQPLPNKGKGKTSGKPSYGQFFQGRGKLISHAGELEEKLMKCCDEQEKDVGENDNPGNYFAVENQENERTLLDCSGLTPLEIKEGNDSDDGSSFNSDCFRFCESTTKTNEECHRRYCQPCLDTQNKNAQINRAVQELALPPNFLEYPQKYSSQSKSKRTGTDCKIKNSHENMITAKKETLPKNFKGFAKQSVISTFVNGQRCQCLTIDDSDQETSSLVNGSNQGQDIVLQKVDDFKDENSSQVQEASYKQDIQRNGSCEDPFQKQQEAFEVGSNTETEDLKLNEDSGENFEKILQELDNALAKIKAKIDQADLNEESAPAASNSQNPDASQLKANSNQVIFQDFCVRKMKDSQQYTTLQNKASLFVNANEFEDFTERHLAILSNQVLAHAEQADLSQHSSFSITAQEDFTRRTFINRTRSNGALSTGSKENFTLPEKRLRQGLNHVIKDKSLLCREKDNSTSSQLSQAARLRIIEKLSNVFVRLRDDVARKKSPILEIRNQNDWNNCLFINNRVIMKPVGEATTTIINFHRKKSKLNFNLIIFLMGKIINMLSEDSSSTKRELYYQLIRFVKSQSQVNKAVDQICCLLDEPPWQLGITAMSKGLIYGDLKIVVASAQAINCNVPGGSLVPQDVQKITQLISDAYFILIVEKDAIFQKLLKEDLPNKLTRPFIMITGKGYPDLNLRFFIKKLMMAMSVPVFILVDADPYGIDIMLTYRFGSLRMSHLNEYLAVPNARWIGVYPSEIIELNVSHQPLTEKDEAKIKNILKRPYCASFSKLKDEMEVLLKNSFKAEIEGLLKSDTFLRDFYLPNKFLTQDYI